MNTKISFLKKIGLCGGYLIYIPDSVGANNKAPILFFNHGIGEKGAGTQTSLALVERNGPPKQIANGSWNKELPFIVVSPQWDSSFVSAANHKPFFDFILTAYKDIHNGNTYMTGLSMGGGTTTMFAAAYPELLKAALSCCVSVSASVEGAAKIANAGLPIWFTHNETDPSVNSLNSKNWHKEIIAKGGKSTLTIFPSSGHDCWTKTYGKDFGGLEWLASFEKAPVIEIPKEEKEIERLIKIDEITYTLYTDETYTKHTS